MNIYLPKLFEKQKEILNAVLNPNYKNISVCYARQCGKTFTALNTAVYWVLNKNNVRYFLPTFKQCKDNIKKIQNNYHQIIKSINYSDMIITFINNNYITFHSTENADTLRGLTAKYAILDELAFYKPNTFTTILEPIVANAKKVIAISTPNGVANQFYTFHQTADIQLHASIYDFPELYNQQQIDYKRSLKSARIFQQEDQALFLDGQNSVFNKISDNAISKFETPNLSETYYIGIDLGNKNDYTVASVIKNNKIVAIYRKTNSDWNTILEELLYFIKCWNPVITLVECNIEGYLIEKLKSHISVKEFRTTNSSKNEIIENMIWEMERDNFFYPNEDYIINELQSFTAKTTSTGKTTYSAIAPAHDDIVISFALALHATKHFKQVNIRPHQNKHIRKI